MIFNSKQLEELEQAHDSTGAFEEEGGDSESNNDDSVDGGAMEWRRQLIEEASENVKRSTTRPVDPTITYEVKSLLFDRETRRFGRVTASVPGYLKIDFLNGGDRELGLLDVTGYLTEFGAQKKAAELALQLGLSEQDVVTELDTLGITPLAADKGKEEEAAAEGADAAKTTADASPKKKAAAKGKAKKPEPVAAKPAAKKATAKKGATKKKATGKGTSDNPIDDPNSYIKANYTTMSNRELARVTGLSEHTIRRKLGEWGLKRKKK